MSVIDKTQDLTDYLATVMGSEAVREAIGEEGINEITEKLEALDLALADPQLNGVPTKVISSFEEWDERVNGVVEFVRADKAIIQFKIHSLSAAEVKKIEIMKVKATPVAPEARQRGDGRPDIVGDKKYAHDMKVYEKEVERVRDLYILWILEHGMEFDIPGKDDDEKLVSLDKMVAGDAVKISNEITHLSNLTPENVRSFI